MKNFIKNIFLDLSLLFEILKSFLITCLVVIAIITALSSIIHNVLKIIEIYEEDKFGYKNLVWVDENRLNVFVSGEGEKTVVVLSEFGTVSPIIQYKLYVDKLISNGYRVVVIEYFGYGYSLSTKEERDVEHFVSEINSALWASGIFGPYIILANGTSGIYAMDYANKFPDSVEKLVLIDSVYPATINESFIQKQIDNQKFNIKITSFAELTGYARILSYIKPDTFGIDKMKERGFSSNDIALYRKMIANRFYTKTMRNEYELLEVNMKNNIDYKFPENLNVIQVLSNEYVNEFVEYKKDSLIKKDIQGYAKDLITNSEIQKIVVINGEKNNLNLTNPDAVILEAGF
ncbi:MAG: alpha/beta hydrolase [Clostridia bacterium]|nr:alpha/beta hydrolase [Clostridia bacterium]